MKNNKLQIQQLNLKIRLISTFDKVISPSIGWIKMYRTSLGMSLQQLGNKLSISKQAVLDIEKREQNGNITINTMKEVAKAMDMHFVYAIVPNDGSLELLIEKKAKEIATKIVMRTTQTMKLEDQAISEKRIKKAIQEKTEELKKEMPKILWD